jgi:hypothetical protein
MINFIVYDESTGEIIRAGQTNNHAMALMQGGNEHGVLITGNSAARPGTHYVSNGAIINMGNAPDEFHKFNYELCIWKDARDAVTLAADTLAAVHNKRRSEYPDIAEQLDMLWHAMDDGTIPRIEPMYSQIKAVKDGNPKPT